MFSQRPQELHTQHTQAATEAISVVGKTQFPLGASSLQGEEAVEGCAMSLFIQKERHFKGGDFLTEYTLSQKVDNYEVHGESRFLRMGKHSGA